MKIRYFTLIGIYLLCASAKAADNLHNFEDVCPNLSAPDCSAKLLKQQSEYAPYSTDWYFITAHYLDLLYETTSLKPLKNLTEQYLNSGHTHPVTFQTQLYFYAAKAFDIYNEKAKAKEYAQQAFKLVSATSESFPNPLRMVEIANLEMVFGDKDTATQMLNRLAQQYRKSKDAKLQHEIYGNLANALYSQGQLLESIPHRKSALFWARKLGFNDNLTMASGNLARTYQLVGQLQLANETYRDAISNFNSEESPNYSIFQLRLAEINTALGEVESAKQHITKVRFTKLLPSHLTLYHQLANKLELNPTAL